MISMKTRLTLLMLTLIAGVALMAASAGATDFRV
jgi:hypothetical protein